MIWVRVYLFVWVRVYNGLWVSGHGIVTYVCVRVYVRTCAMAMGWLGLVGSLKLQVCFAEYRLFYVALLQKRSITLRILLIVATPHA